MMKVNKSEYLLVCLMEECAEIQQAASKALRFGMENGHPDGQHSNRAELSKEIGELDNLVEMLSDRDLIHGESRLHGFLSKRKRLEEYMRVSCQCGTLEED